VEPDLIDLAECDREPVIFQKAHLTFHSGPRYAAPFSARRCGLRPFLQQR
jgi:hypothetical protein